MDNADELQVIGEKDIYVQSVEDIPQGAKLLESVKNRPIAYVGFGILALVVLIFMMPQYWIALSLAIVGCVVVFFLSKNEPVLDIYEGFMVCHKKGDPNRVCIIPNEHLIYWQLVPGNTSVIQIYFADQTDAENALCATVHTINSYQASNALDKYHRDKAIVEIRRSVDREKRLIKRRQK